MAVFLDTPVNISPATTGSWQTLDLDSYIADLPADLSGVMLKFVTTSSVALGARPTGSSDNRTTANYFAGASLYCGCDGSHQIDVYRGSTALTVYVVGYFTADAVFYTNAYDKSPSTTSAWVDIDCSAEIPIGAVAAIFDVRSSGTSGLRNNGSTDDRRTSTSTRSGAIVGIDSNRTCEFNTTVASGTLYLVGYLTQGVFKTNGVDVSIATTASYVDVDLSSDSDSATASCAVIEVKSSLDTSYGLRTNGTTGDVYLKHQYKEWGVTGLDANKVFEGKISSVSVDFFVIGYLVTPSGGGTSYTESLTTLADAYATVTDISTYIEAAQAIITAGVSVADTTTMLESVLATAQAADSITALATRADNLLAVIQAADSVQSAQAMIDILIVSAGATASVTDSQTAAGLEALQSAASAADSVQDVVVALEQFSTTISAQATVTDEQIAAAAENLLTAATAITSVTDLQLMTDNLTIMATSGASIGEIGSYLEQLAAAASGQASVTDVLVGSFIGRYLAVEYAKGRRFIELAAKRSFIEYARGRA